MREGHLRGGREGAPGSRTGHSQAQRLGNPAEPRSSARRRSGCGGARETLQDGRNAAGGLQGGWKRLKVGTLDPPIRGRGGGGSREGRSGQ